MQHFHGRELFFRHDVERIDDAHEPRILPYLAEVLGGRGLLVLGGRYEDKPGVARQVARRVALANPAAPRALLEWQGGPDFALLLHGLETAEQGAVVLLPGLVPSDVASDLLAVRRAAAASRVDVIATTEKGRRAWKLRPGEEGFWRDLDPEGLFDPAIVLDELEAQLYRIRSTLPEDALSKEGDAGATLAGVPLAKVAARLLTPGNAMLFAQRLASRGDEELNADAVDALVRESLDPVVRVERWFDGLRPDEQLLALGLCLFDGFYDDQLFAALERWVRHIRSERDPSVRAFDYGDLNALDTFFTGVSTEGASIKVTTLWPEQRRAIFQAAWSTHRRQILCSLSVLTEMVVESTSGRRNWELYGSGERRRLVRNAAHEALSDLGLIAVGSIELPLVSLASRRRADVQAVAAEAVARWRLYDGGDERLLDLLDRWQRDGRVRAIMQSMLDDGSSDTRAAQAHVRATVALAVGFASLYDEPNALIAPLHDLVRDLSYDGGLVRKRFVGYTLPLAVSRHLRQLQPLLEEMARDEELRRAIAESLAFAYRSAPDEVVAVLDAWYARAAATRPNAIDPRRLTDRDLLLMLIAQTYGAIEYSPRRPLRINAAFSRLKEILATESHPRVRETVMAAIAEQAESWSAEIDPLLSDLLEVVSPAECDEVVRVLTRAYLQQRAELEGGDATIEVDGQTYRVWLSAGRPVTAVEQAMNRWVRDAAHPIAQRIAFRASITFVQALDAREADEVARLRYERSLRPTGSQPALVANAPLRWAATEPGWYTGTLVPWLATAGSPDDRPPVRALLPDVLAERGSRPRALEFLLDRWQGMQGDAAANGLAARLRSAMSWHASAGMLVLPAAFLLFLLFVVLVASLGNAG